jgi:hypothetical protein
VWDPILPLLSHSRALKGGGMDFYNAHAVNPDS